MEAYRIVLTSWTAGFRCPNLISGVQLSLDAPPMSTIYGLLSASTGKYVTPLDCSFAYCFRYTKKAFDLETIHKLELGKKNRELLNRGTSDIVKRQVLFDNALILYVENENVAKSFFEPVFPLLLGRSGDLATVEKIEKVSLEKKKGIEILGTVFPMNKGIAYGQIQALPMYFTDTIPRHGIGIEPFYILSASGKWKNETNINFLDFDNWIWDKEKVSIDVEGYNDAETGIDLWFG